MTEACVLVVDDNETGRYLKARALQNAGFEVRQAGTAAESISLLDEHAFHVAVLDVKLPDMHGFELCRTLRERFPTLGILQTSATFTSAADRVGGLEIGADAYLVEPMEDTELVAITRALLRVRHAERAQKATEARFAQFAQASPNILWIYDPEKRQFEYLSPSIEDLLGHKAEEVQRDPDLWFGKLRPEDRSALSKMLEEGKPADIEYRIVRADGVEKWVRDKIFVLPREIGSGVQIAGVARDVTESKAAEQQRELLVKELNHRVKNTLAIVQAIAAHTRQSALSPEAFDASFSARLDALGKAHDLLTRSQWAGTMLQDAVDAALEPFAGDAMKDRFSAGGPAVWLAPNIAVILTLALHELATNATKYGAWSDETGQVAVRWSVDTTDAPNTLRLDWQERGGPPVRAPARKGFGTMLLERVLAYDSQGEAHLSFPVSGLEFEFKLPLSERVKLA